FAWAGAFSPDGKLLARACGRVDLIESATGKVRHVLPLDLATVDALAFSPDGRTLVVADTGRKVRFWDCASGKVLHTSANQHVRPLAFCPDGKTLALGGWDSTVRLREVARPEDGAGTVREVRLPCGRPAGVGSLAFARDGKRLLAGCDGGGLWLLDLAPQGDP